ncbi:hypothetical protein QJS66_21775 [Kocuria rhizophila]|nr:hypothetical protein QJS66_21775 [Kocuria rhizophila]
MLLRGRELRGVACRGAGPRPGRLQNGRPARATEDRVFLGRHVPGWAPRWSRRPSLRTPCNTISRRWSDWTCPRDMEAHDPHRLLPAGPARGPRGRAGTRSSPREPTLGARPVGDVGDRPPPAPDRGAYRGLASAPEFPGEAALEDCVAGEDGLL